MERSQVIEELGKPLDASRVRTRDAGRGRSVPYLEGYDLIATANRVFGFDGWSYRVDEVTVTTTTQGRILYRARVTVEAIGVSRSDVGVSIVEVPRTGDNQGIDTPDAHDMAYKGAATDALKRALRSFGAQFGNELYDKNDAGRGEQRAAQGNGKVTNIGELMAWAREAHGMQRAAVLKVLGVDAPADIKDLRKAAVAIVRAAREGNS